MDCKTLLWILLLDIILFFPWTGGACIVFFSYFFQKVGDWLAAKLNSVERQILVWVMKKMSFSNWEQMF